MSQNCGRIYIKVKEPSDWEKLKDLPVQEEWYLYADTSKDIWGRLTGTEWFIDGEWAPEFGYYGLEGMVSDIAKAIGYDRCLIIADLTDINVDGGYEVYYSLGDEWGSNSRSLGYAYDPPAITDVQEWLKWAKIKITTDIVEHLYRFGEEFYTGNVHCGQWLYIAVKHKDIWGKLAEADLTDPGYGIEGGAAKLFGSQEAYDMEIRDFNIASGYGDNPLLRLVQTLTEAAGEGNLFVLSYCPDSVVSTRYNRCAYVINGEAGTSEIYNDLKDVSKDDIAGSIRRMGKAVNRKILNYAAGFPSERMDFARKKLGLPCRADVNAAPETELVIPDGTKLIKNNEYKGREYLRSVVIPDSVTSIGKNAFSGCKNLEKVMLPAGLESIGQSAFSKCESLKQLQLPAGVTAIGEKAFSSCKALKDIKLNDGLKKIETEAFKICKSLETMEIPDSVEYIGYNAFKGCSKLKRINMPAGLKKIEFDVFVGCKELSDFIVPEQIAPESVGSWYAGSIFGHGQRLKGKSNYEIYIGKTLVLADKEKIIVREGTESISDCALNNVKKLVLALPVAAHQNSRYADWFNTTLSFGDGIETLEELVLPDGLLEIDEKWFSGMQYHPIKKITIPASVTEIKTDESEYAAFPKMWNVTICGGKGTVAEEFAVKYGFNFEESCDDSISEFSDIHSYMTDCETELLDIETIEFGSYPQDSNGAKKPIEWIVLEKQENKVLVISKYGLEYKSYNDKDEDITWENCTLRRWLNEEFIETAFSEDEKEMVEKTSLRNADNNWYGTDGGKDTVDRVFLLSIDEVRKYFSSWDARICKPSEYAKSQHIRCYTKYREGACSWWLRSPGDDHKCAATIQKNGVGENFGGGCVDGVFNAIRPALWIKRLK